MSMYAKATRILVVRGLLIQTDTEILREQSVELLEQQRAVGSADPSSEIGSAHPRSDNRCFVLT
jgi:hypothetical protein